MSRVSKKETPGPVLKPSSLLHRANVAFIAVLHLLAALLFFTNLTRNPYYTQIALLNAGIAFVGIVWAIDVLLKGEIQLPRFSFEAPLLGFLLVAFLSSVFSWFHHTMLQPGIFFESTRVWSFTLVNCVMALYLPGIFTTPAQDDNQPIQIWWDIFLAIMWSALWLGFHSNKDPDPTALIWDSYGGIVWGLAFVYAYFRTRRGRAIEFFHVLFFIAVVASLYGILQYSGKDVIWASLIQPYGGRPVSTFGNPNFLSSYVMMISPLAAALGFHYSDQRRWGYLFVALISALCVLCTLTRSSYIGFLASYLVLGILLIPRDQLLRLGKFLGIGLLLFVLLIILFPKTPISSVQSPLLRFTEVFDAMKTGKVYGPWHQRILIWSSAWDMLKENHFLGKGWGCFEMFYPYYQGKYLFTPVLSLFRTHANNAHNILLELWAQTGFLGMGMALWLFVVMVIAGWKVVRKSESTSRFLSAGLLGGMIGMVVDNFFGNVSIFFATPAFLFWWYAGALYHQHPGSHNESRPLSGSLGRPLLIFFAVFCGAMMTYFAKRWQQEVYYFEGFKQSKIGDVVKSVKALEKAYEWFPGEVNCNYELGNSYASYARMLESKGLNEEAKKNQQKSIDAYIAALHANPGYDEIYFNLGVTQLQLGDREKAFRNLEIAMFINPLLREVYGALGNAYVQAGDLNNAVRVYSQSVVAFPKDKDFWNNLGYCYSQLKNHEKSFDSYKHAVMVDPSFNQGWQNLANASVALGRRDDPIMQVPGLIQEMETKIAARNFREALVPAEKVLKTLPDSADAHLSVANILFYLDQKEKSEAEFKKAIELRPTFGIAFVNLGRLYQIWGKTDLARQSFKQALEIDSNDKEAKQALDSLPK